MIRLESGSLISRASCEQRFQEVNEAFRQLSQEPLVFSVGEVARATDASSKVEWEAVAEEASAVQAQAESAVMAEVSRYPSGKRAQIRVARGRRGALVPAQGRD